VPTIDRARAALDRGAWREALAILDEDVAPGTAEWLQLKGRACYGSGDLEGAVGSFERLHALQLAAGAEVEAADAGLTAALYLLIDSGLMAPVRAWVRRAERLLTSHPDAAPHAMAATVRTYERFMSGDADGARIHATLAVELGERLGVPAAVMIGRVALARLRISAGEVECGLELLDEIAVQLLAGALDPLTTGMMFCELVCAAQSLARFERAREWADLMERWRLGAGFGSINGRCRVHRAELLSVSGPGDEAEREALEACAELRPWLRREFGWPLVELGNIRLRRGDLSGAEDAFLDAHARAWCPQPGLALLRLEQGRADEALALITDSIVNPLQIPSKERPPLDDLWLAPLLGAQAEIGAAVGDVGATRAAAEQLARIAQRYGGPGLESTASLAAARAELAAGEPSSAIAPALQSITGWAGLEAPYEGATARMVLGEAYAAVGLGERGRMEWVAALEAFERFGAIRMADRARRLLFDVSSPPASALRVATPAMLVRNGPLRRISFGGSSVTVPDLKGYRYLERLLADPGREWHVLDLVAAERGSPSGPAEAGMPTLDHAARDAYRRRLMEVEQDIDEATSMNDLGRAELAQRDRAFLVAELTAAVGLHGRERLVRGSSERARTSVLRCLRYAVAQLAEHHAELAAHLRGTVRTGTFCSYRCDPLAPVEWRTREGVV
jgi:tetratricopeptide (TPR) repeat protein